eukprot:m.362365 g.362365  ORF g.362365 m.362365 type:complete len:114 (-) comp20404_c0_seq1:54-395(-)
MVSVQPEVFVETEVTVVEELQLPLQLESVVPPSQPRTRTRTQARTLTGLVLFRKLNQWLVWPNSFSHGQPQTHASLVLFLPCCSKKGHKMKTNEYTKSSLFKKNNRLRVCKPS